jgi:hypothetical protein
MDYGGWEEYGQCGAKACDGMPRPDIPGWHLGKDDHGCAYWIEPPRTSAEVCGAAMPRDSGVD